MNWPMFWAAFAGTLTGLAVAGAVAAAVLKVVRYRRRLDDLTRVADSFRMPSPWWLRWRRPYEEWNARTGKRTWRGKRR